MWAWHAKPIQAYLKRFRRREKKNRIGNLFQNILRVDKKKLLDLDCLLDLSCLFILKMGAIRFRESWMFIIITTLRIVAFDVLLLHDNGTHKRHMSTHSKCVCNAQAHINVANKTGSQMYLHKKFDTSSNFPSRMALKSNQNEQAINEHSSIGNHV